MFNEHSLPVDNQVGAPEREHLSLLCTGSYSEVEEQYETSSHTTQHHIWLTWICSSKSEGVASSAERADAYMQCTTALGIDAWRTIYTCLTVIHADPTIAGST